MHFEIPLPAFEGSLSNRQHCLASHCSFAHTVQRDQTITRESKKSSFAVNEFQPSAVYKMEHAGQGDGNNRHPEGIMLPFEQQHRPTSGMVAMLDRRCRRFREEESRARVVTYPAPSFLFPNLDETTRRIDELAGSTPTFSFTDPNDDPSSCDNGRRILLRKRNRRSLTRAFVSLDCDNDGASDGTDDSSSMVLAKPNPRKHARGLDNHNKDGTDGGAFIS